MRVACVLVDHFPFRLEATHNPKLAGRHVILYQRLGSRREVVDISPALSGVLPGMSLHEAQSRWRDAILVEADPARYEQVYEHILGRLGQWSPVVERAKPGCAYVGIDGLETTYGTEDHLIDRLLNSFPRVLEPRLGISNGKLPAYIAALKAPPGRAFYPPVPLKEFLASFSVDVLPAPWDIKDRLHGFGLHTLGHLAALPIGPVQAQFGPLGARIWELAQGIDHAPLQPLLPREETKETTSFATPIAHIGPLLIAIEALLGRLFSRPEVKGCYTRSAMLEAQVLNRPTWQRRFMFKMPVGDRPRAYHLMKDQMDNLALPGPVESMSLTLGDLVGEVGSQESLFYEVRKRDRLREAIQALKAAQGQNPIYQVREIEPWSRIPERQTALVPYEP